MRRGQEKCVSLVSHTPLSFFPTLFVQSTVGKQGERVRLKEARGTLD